MLCGELDHSDSLLIGKAFNKSQCGIDARRSTRSTPDVSISYK
jgi:hypothetical protein